MGKSRRNRTGPSSRKPPKPPADPELAALRERKILPALRALQSPDPQARLSAVGSITNIVQDTKCRKLLLREQIVHILLGETLTDTALESRLAGWEILRVLAQEEAADFCVHLYRLNILTTSSHAIKLVTKTLESRSTSFAYLSGRLRDSIWELTSCLIFILNAVAEVNDDAPEKIVSDPTFTGFLFLLIDRNQTPETISNAALACLWTLSEDNKQLAEVVITADPAESGPLSVLRQMTERADSKAIFACGILHNVLLTLEGGEDSTRQDVSLGDANLIGPLSVALRTFHPHREVANGKPPITPDDAQLALEILALIGTSLQDVFVGGGKASEAEAEAVMEKITDDEDMADVNDDDDDEEGEGEEEDDDAATSVSEGAAAANGNDYNDDDDDDEMGEADIHADIEMVTDGGDGGDGGDGATTDDQDLALEPILKELCQSAIPELTRLATTPLYPSLLEYNIQMVAISALNNIAWSVACLDFAGGRNLATAQLWQPVGRQIWDKVILPVLLSDTADIEVAIRITTLAWAIARTMRGCLPLERDEPKRFISLYHAISNNMPAGKEKPAERDGGLEASDPLQSPGVKCVGVLGQLALHPCAVQVNREVGVFLVSLLTALPSTPAADAVEAINQLFDIYGDEEYAYETEVFWKDNMIQHLEAVLPKVKAMLKSIDGRSMAELRGRADEADLNLTRFIQYKKKNKPA